MSKKSLKKAYQKELAMALRPRLVKKNLPQEDSYLTPQDRDSWRNNG